MKKFLKKTEGFTLVELIVVIAILGILTAIAVPTYSGYVKKANEAGDTQRLSAANTAIAAALTENNLPMEDADDVTAYLAFTDDNSGTTAGCTVTVAKGANASAQAVLDDFTTYHGGTTIEFEYYNGVTVGSDGNLKGVEPTT